MKKLLILLSLILVCITLILSVKYAPQKAEAIDGCEGVKTVPIELAGTTKDGTATSFQVLIKWRAISDVVADPYDSDLTQYDGAVLSAFQGEFLRGQVAAPIFGYRETTLKDKTVTITPTNFDADESGQANLEIYLMISFCSIGDKALSVAVNAGEQGAPENKNKQPGESCNPRSDTCEGGGKCEETGTGSNYYFCTCSSDSQCPSNKPYCNQKNASSNLYFCGEQPTRADQLPYEGFEGYFTRAGSSIRVLSVNEKKDRRVTFHAEGLRPGEPYWVCGKPTNEGCSDKEERFIPIIAGQDGKAQVDLCGDGSDAFKGGEGICDDSRDYFYGLSVYRVTVMDQIDFRTPIGHPVFLFIDPYFPETKMGDTQTVKDGTIDDGIESPGIGKTISAGSGGIKVTIKGARPRETREELNNYQILLISDTGGYKEEDCVTVTGINGAYESNPAVFGLFSDDDTKQIPSGTYTLRVNERINEDDFYIPGEIYLGVVGSNVAKRFFGTDGDIGRNACDGGFTYYDIHLNITKDKNAYKVVVTDVEIDPNNVVASSINPNSGRFPLPCVMGKLEGSDEEVEITDQNRTSLRTCTQFATALGPIGATSTGFINSIFGWTITIAGLAAVALFIYGGYTLMTSRGDKEKIAKGREIFTNAIVGLLFILLSLVILEFIGVDILRIPGFER